MPAEEPPQTVGKGRPTPKRRDAERRRRQAIAPTSRREAYRLRRQSNQEQRRTARSALIGGDESNLPPRDAGPVKRYVRDLVDSRRGVGTVFMPAAFVLLLLSMVRGPVITAIVQLGYLALVIGVVVDSVLLGRRIRVAVTERFGPDKAQGVRLYAAMRSLQFRRLRVPPPKVSRGQAPR